MRGISWIEYNSEGTVVRSETYDKAEWREWTPETIGEAAYSQICTMVKDESPPQKTKEAGSKKKKS